MVMDETISKTPFTDKKRERYMRTSILIIFVLFGQSIATLLGRLYFTNGGNSKWMGTLVQMGGFPILLIPLLFLYQAKKNAPQHAPHNNDEKPRLRILLSAYLVLGIINAANCSLFSIGLAYLPVSTFSLICASQLAFNAFFSYFLNAQKFTPFTMNSLVLVTMSSALLVFQNDQSDSSMSTKHKYAIGFLCAIGAAASAALYFSLAQCFFTKVLKTPTFRKVLNLIICQNFVASSLILIALFVSQEWKSLNGEMESYKLGKVSYVMTLVWSAVSWAVFNIGFMGLIFEVSALFSNVIAALSFPIVPIFAVIFFHDKMNGVKVISLLLAIWGSASFIYQHYLDDLESENKVKEVSSANKV